MGWKMIDRIGERTFFDRERIQPAGFTRGRAGKSCGSCADNDDIKKGWNCVQR